MGSLIMSIMRSFLSISDKVSGKHGALAPCVEWSEFSMFTTTCWTAMSAK